MDLRKFASIAERDVDLLLVEEFSVNPRFTEWFVAQVSGTAPAEFSQADCWHSVTDGSLGESDLIVRVADDLAVLIENKIGAAAQPDQAARYRERGLKGVREGYWKRFTTCMVAPAAYLESNREAGEYDAAISYETLRDWFQRLGRKGHRTRHRSSPRPSSRIVVAIRPHGMSTSPLRGLAIGLLPTPIS